MYHAACKVEFQPFNRSYSRRTFFQNFIKTACASECNNCCPHKSSLVLERLFVSLPRGSGSVAIYCVRNCACTSCTPSCRCWSSRRFFRHTRVLCSHANGVRGPTGTRRNLVGSHFVRVFFGDLNHAATASGIAALLLLLLLPRLGFCC